MGPATAVDLMQSGQDVETVGSTCDEDDEGTLKRIPSSSTKARGVVRSLPSVLFSAYTPFNNSGFDATQMEAL
jgi:hypothetical protein